MTGKGLPSAFVAPIAARSPPVPGLRRRIFRDARTQRLISLSYSRLFGDNRP